MFSGWTALRPLTESAQQFLMEIQKMEHSKALDPGQHKNHQKTHVHQDLQAEITAVGLSLMLYIFCDGFTDLLSDNYYFIKYTDILPLFKSRLKSHLFKIICSLQHPLQLPPLQHNFV